LLPILPIAFWLVNQETSQLAMRITKQLLRKLSRITASGRYIPEIDGLRFLAILPVVLFHIRTFMLVKSENFYTPATSNDWLVRLTAHGHYGVQLFFVISGFVLALPFAAHFLKATGRVKLRDYYLRRLTRLEPPYILCLLICFLLLILINKYSAEGLWPHLLTGLFYAHTLVYGTHNPLNLITWSLEIEIQFYLLVPLLARVFTIRNRVNRRKLLIFTCLVLIIIQSLFFPAGGRLELSILNFLQYFLIGFLLADVYLCDWNEAPHHQLRWDLAALTGLALTVWLFQWPRLTHLLLPFLIFWIYYSVFRGVYVTHLLTRPLLTVIGGMCYTIYLIHFQIIAFVIRLLPPFKISNYFYVNYLLQLPIFLLVIMAASVIFFVSVERPCMRKDWPRRLMRKLHGLASPQAKLGKSVVSSTE
jgi:peptidoglycan/LPS O-acetylase OafA/YrhL